MSTATLSTSDIFSTYLEDSSILLGDDLSLTNTSASTANSANSTTSFSSTLAALQADLEKGDLSAAQKEMDQLEAASTSTASTSTSTQNSDSTSSTSSTASSTDTLGFLSKLEDAIATGTFTDAQSALTAYQAQSYDGLDASTSMSLQI